MCSVRDASLHHIHLSIDLSHYTWSELYELRQWPERGAGGAGEGALGQAPLLGVPGPGHLHLATHPHISTAAMITVMVTGPGPGRVSSPSC